MRSKPAEDLDGRCEGFLTDLAVQAGWRPRPRIRRSTRSRASFQDAVRLSRRWAANVTESEGDWSHGVAKGLFLAHRGRETGMRKLKRCRSGWAQTGKEIADAAPPARPAIEQGVKPGSCICGCGNGMRQFRVSIVACFLLLSERVLVATNQGVGEQKATTQRTVRIKKSNL